MLIHDQNWDRPGTPQLALVLVPCLAASLLVLVLGACTPPPTTQENCQRLERGFHLLPWQSAGCFAQQQLLRSTSSGLRSGPIRHISPTPPPPPAAPCRLLGTAQYLTYPYLPESDSIPNTAGPSQTHRTGFPTQTHLGLWLSVRIATSHEPTTRTDFFPPPLLTALRSRGRPLLGFGLSLRSRRTLRPSCPSPIAIAL